MPLAGYFNPRPNQGVLDELFVRVALFQQGRTVTGVVSFDLVFVTADLVARIRKRLAAKDVRFGHNLIFCGHRNMNGRQKGWPGRLTRAPA